MHSGVLRARQLYVLSLFLIILTFLAVNLIIIQIINYPFYSGLAKDQHNISIPLEPKRGTIFDRRMRPLALNLNVDSVFANPREVSNKQASARQIAHILKVNESFVLERLKRDKGFVWLKRRVTKRQADAVKRLKLRGIGLIKESKRFYPGGSLACHVLGAVDVDNKGLDGLELVYDKYMRGEEGVLVSMQDGKRRKLKYCQSEYVPPRDGFSLHLTIDEVIQNIAEEELKAMYKKYNAKGASIIVMDPVSGDILAMANLPSYDSNFLSSRSDDSVKNKAICDFFEPGSVFKIVTASAALEEKKVTFDDKFFCENGEYRVGKRILHDHTPHGTMTFKEVIEKSSNIGTVKVAALLGPYKMSDYISRFGFRTRTGIELPGEALGMNRDISKWSKVSMYAVPMGQEVTATTIQLARAISVIANGGFIVKPRVVKEILDAEGATVKSFPAGSPKRAISQDTSSKMKEIMAGVIENGTGKKAKVDGYRAGGKTGTAQKVEPGGVYSHDRFIASFIGFAPLDDPKLAIAVCFDEPRPVYYGGDVAAPVFSKVAGASLKYLNANSPTYVLNTSRR